MGDLCNRRRHRDSANAMAMYMGVVYQLENNGEQTSNLKRKGSLHTTHGRAQWAEFYLDNIHKLSEKVDPIFSSSLKVTINGVCMELNDIGKQPEHEVKALMDRARLLAQALHL